MSKKKIMISFRVDEYMLNELERMVPRVEGVGNASDLLRAALSSFISRYKRKHNII